MNDEVAAKTLSALANRSRLAVMRQLIQAGADGLAAGQIAEGIGASPSQTSFHLAALSEAGLGTSTRRSRHIHYAANYAAMGALVTFILEDCCSGSPDVKACCP